MFGHAYAAAVKFANACLHAQRGDVGIIECAYVAHRRINGDNCTLVENVACLLEIQLHTNSASMDKI
ncbi:hypothetical protein VNO80_09676 [Phaseolus coccineus]|uniref:Uncharacterized protein n=1 Tax=Phaseolus coccineus TaxID=3886 RepID=A0AAN9NC19_PHACN